MATSSTPIGKEVKAEPTPVVIGVDLNDTLISSLDYATLETARINHKKRIDAFSPTLSPEIKTILHNAALWRDGHAKGTQGELKEDGYSSKLLASPKICRALFRNSIRNGHHVAMISGNPEPGIIKKVLKEYVGLQRFYRNKVVTACQDLPASSEKMAIIREAFSELKQDPKAVDFVMIDDKEEVLRLAKAINAKKYVPIHATQKSQHISEAIQYSADRAIPGAAKLIDAEIRGEVLRYHEAILKKYDGDQATLPNILKNRLQRIDQATTSRDYETLLCEIDAEEDAKEDLQEMLAIGTYVLSLSKVHSTRKDIDELSDALSEINITEEKSESSMHLEQSYAQQLENAKPHYSKVLDIWTRFNEEIDAQLYVKEIIETHLKERIEDKVINQYPRRPLEEKNKYFKPVLNAIKNMENLLEELKTKKKSGIKVREEIGEHLRAYNTAAREIVEFEKKLNSFSTSLATLLTGIKENGTKLLPYDDDDASNEMSKNLEALSRSANAIKNSFENGTDTLEESTTKLRNLVEPYQSLSKQINDFIKKQKNPGCWTACWASCFSKPKKIKEDILLTEYKSEEKAEERKSSTP